jgi:hypothetical protein
MSTCPQDLRLPPQTVKSRNSADNLKIQWLHPALVLPAIGGLALVLFSWGISAPFETSDQAAMAYLVQHNYGVKWFFAHEYGPVLPVIQRAWGELLTAMGFPLQEWSFRLPIVGLCLMQVIVTYPLMRRLRCSPSVALAGTAFCAVLPQLVSNAHYAWGYSAVRMLCGTIALWMTLMFFDTRQRKYLVPAGFAVFIHCISGAYAMALPATLIIAWLLVLKTSSQQSWAKEMPLIKNPFLKSSLLGFVLPCLVAAGFIIFCWLWTDQGQIARLLSKQDKGDAGFYPAQLFNCAALWVEQTGYLMAILTAGGLVFGLSRAISALKHTPIKNENLNADHRKGLLAVWCLLAILPLALLVKGDNIGYAGFYLPEAVYPATLLTMMALAALYRRLNGHRVRQSAVVVISGAAFLHMAFGSIDACLARGNLKTYTGVNVPWGSIRPDTGVKAAGWYVRQHVPTQATILSLHTNKGMELPVAEYYCGRKVLAGYELDPEFLPRLTQEFHNQADVIIVSADHSAIVEYNTSFKPVFTALSNGTPVRKIFAREASTLPVLKQDVEKTNRLYDQSFSPRQIPTPLAAPDDFVGKLKRYQDFLTNLKQRKSHE